MAVKRILVGLALVSLAGAGYALAAGSTVTLTGEGPKPEVTTINWGDTVTFANGDSKAHGVTIPAVTVASPTLQPGENWTYAFAGRARSYNFRQTESGRSFFGSVVVALNGKVTLSASPALVDYGRTVELAGVSPYPGTAVNVLPRTAGSDWSGVGTVTAGEDGAFAYEFKPAIGATYHVRVAADQLSSVPVKVRVKPVLTLKTTARRTKAGREITLSARVVPATAATSLDLERLAQPGRWQSEVRKRVGASGRVTFKWKAREGTTRLRVAVRPATLRIGWTPSASASLTVIAAKAKR
jgi:plastocyanin